ncbi:MAG: retropepsin-like domain-containing protein, partial [Candidatus Eremiobacteraeota bacterium]|nr:retropepsin-like domain-containing protein [Candidatus Eremiobacteraeota bacterium]
MRATFVAAALVVFLALTSPVLVHAAGSFPHAPIMLASGLDMSRATIPVDVDGHRYACVLDTGTSAMLVSRAVAQSAGLVSEAPVDEISPDGFRYADRHTHLAQFDVAGYAMRDVPALISSKLSGDVVLCGYDFFAEVPTLIDRDRQQVTLFPPAGTMDRMRCMPVDLRPRVPVGRLQVNGAWIEKVVLDSGMVGGGAIWNGALGQPSPAPGPMGMACGYHAAIGFF